jgi:hypothetical protein
MSKLLATTVLALAALSQATNAAPGNPSPIGHKPTVQRVVIQKIGVPRRQFNHHVVNRQILVKSVVAKPRFVKTGYVEPAIIQPVYVKAVQPKHHLVLKPLHYVANYKPMYRYYPLATYSYDTAPKQCELMLEKTHYGMVKKVWRCVLVDKVEIAPAKTVTCYEPAPVKIIERTIEKHTIEKQVPAPTTDEVLPPK